VRGVGVGTPVAGKKERGEEARLAEELDAGGEEHFFLYVAYLDYGGERGEELVAGNEEQPLFLPTPSFMERKEEVMKEGRTTLHLRCCTYD